MNMTRWTASGLRKIGCCLPNYFWRNPAFSRGRGRHKQRSIKPSTGLAPFFFSKLLLSGIVPDLPRGSSSTSEMNPQGKLLETPASSVCLARSEEVALSVSPGTPGWKVRLPPGGGPALELNWLEFPSPKHHEVDPLLFSLMGHHFHRRGRRGHAGFFGKPFLRNVSMIRSSLVFSF